MSCTRCPHHVRHGHADTNNNIMFVDLCGLKVKKLERDELERAGIKKTGPDKKAGAVRNPKQYTPTENCEQVPFPVKFEYMSCHIYIETFKSTLHKNTVIPTKDIQYSEALAGGSITDMELL